MTTEEFEYRGYTVPNNTLLLPCGDNLSRDRTRYDDVDAFKPERFLGDDLESHLSARQIDFRKRDHVNYGFGRRMCPGMALLLTDLATLFRIVQLTLLKRYTSRGKLALYPNLSLFMGF